MRKKRKQKHNIISQKAIRTVIYCLLFFLGVGAITFSFFVSENWVNVLSGVGTGLLTSLVVSVIINTENDSREKREKQSQKQYLLNGIVESSLDVYDDIIRRINEYLTLSESEIKPIYELYNDFKPFCPFAEYLKRINLDTLTKTEKKRLNTLFNFDNYRIDYLIAELKHLPKQQYFLQGILTKEECSALLSNTVNESYLGYAEHISDFWSDEVLDLEKCIQFLRMTIYICANTISAFDFVKKRAYNIEENLKKYREQFYFDKVYSHTDVYIDEQAERSDAEEEYYATHPDVWESLQRNYEEWENETDEDIVLRDLHFCICGFSIYGIDELLNKISPESNKVMAFFREKDVRASLMKRKKLKKAILNHFGKDYLKSINTQTAGGQMNGQA